MTYLNLQGETSSRRRRRADSVPRNTPVECWFSIPQTPTRRSSTCTSLVRKSAPMVALYCLLNLRFTYWFISDVLPTLLTMVAEDGEGQNVESRQNESLVQGESFRCTK